MPRILTLGIGLVAVLMIGLGAPLAGWFRGAWAAYLAVAVGAALAAAFGSAWAARFPGTAVGSRVGAAALGVLGAFSLAGALMQASAAAVPLASFLGWEPRAFLITLLGFVLYPLAALTFVLRGGRVSRACLIALSLIIAALWYLFWFRRALSPFPVRIGLGRNETFRLLGLASVAVPLCFAAALAAGAFRRAPQRVGRSLHWRRSPGSGAASE